MAGDGNMPVYSARHGLKPLYVFRNADAYNRYLLGYPKPMKGGFLYMKQKKAIIGCLSCIRLFGLNRRCCHIS